jgi:hypothetical protein
MSAYAQIEALGIKLSTARAKLWDAVRQLDASDFTSPLDGGWSVKDILAHLAAAEALNVKFAKLMVSQEWPVQLEALAGDYPDYIGPFSLDGFNGYLTDKLRATSLAEVFDVLERTGADTLAWVEALTPEDLERGGEHAAWGDQTVRGMLRILALHDKVHTQDILKRVRQFGD